MNTLMPRSASPWLLPLVFTAILGGCTKNEKKDGGAPDAGPIPSGVGIGGACTSLADCRSGLTCSASQTCVPSGSVIQGGSCVVSAECSPGNYCTQQGRCAAAGTQIAGGTCASEGDCGAGLLCAQSGLTGVCQAAGSGDIGRSCLATTDCMAGLLCIHSQCTKGFVAVKPPLVCNATPSLSPRVLFHVPRATDPTTNMDFYALPFPNDIRITGGKVNLTGHPVPGATLLPFDVVERYLTAIETELTGFGANEAMYVRFSKPFDTTRFPGDCGANLVDITPTSPTYGQNLGLTCTGTNANGSYICGPYVALRPLTGSPLRPGTTYALLVRGAIVDELGVPFGPDDDFTAMLAPTPPAAPELTAAYAAYQPLRDYISAGKVAAAELATAAVFTVQKYEEPLAGIAAAVAAAPAPQVTAIVRCDDPTAVSPCDDGKIGAEHTRGCLPADVASTTYTTYQGTLLLPVLQNGVVPYLTPTDGGSIEYDSTGAAVIHGSEKVCFSLTVPKGAAPATGWPLVVYGHGTGGSYRSIVDLGLANDYAIGVAPAGLGIGIDGGVASVAPLPLAVFGFDGVMHGTRNGGSAKAVGELVYNFLNPPAARDNALQAAADLLAIPRSLASFAGLGIPLDGSRLLLYGHSQGGNAASLVAARQSAYGAIVMSGTGGNLVYTLLGKTNPIDIPSVLPYLLGEPGPSAVNEYHPVLNLMQLYFERADSVNFARRLFTEPLADMTAHHVLHVYGTKDTYSVVATQRAYALAANFKVAPPGVDAYGLDFATGGPPFSNNEFFGRVGKLTALQIQYEPTAAYDGHFVSTQDPQARAAIQQMLVTAARDGIPTVTP
jgi:predicted esterase